ncbi:hypothetical protein EI94DRAFT_1725716 [Lactarius quietus]|nr:hypothetical protein EI94DRAFT_1725716 [Lactarius quietus]
MASSSTPTSEGTGSSRAYRPRYSFDDTISLSSSTSDGFSGTRSFISFASDQSSIASYKTEKSVNSRKSHYNTRPRHKYAGLEHLRPPKGPVSSEFDDAARASASVLETDLKDDSESDKSDKANYSGTSTSSTAEHDTQAMKDDILTTVEQFRILSVARTDVSKSSLISCVFGIKSAKPVSQRKLGDSDIYQEYVSRDDEFYVLRDSQVLKPGDLSDFSTVYSFLEQRSQTETLPWNDKVHCLWLCVEAQTAGGWVFETENENFLEFVLLVDISIPIVIVFTQYDRLVRTKRAELKEDHPRMDDDTLDSRSMEEASKALATYLGPLERVMRPLNIQMPPYTRVSSHGRLGFQQDISELAEVTRKAVKERLQDDVSDRIVREKAQRGNTPVKVEACIAICASVYTRYLAEPGGAHLGQKLLRDCLMRIHTDVINCWDFKGDILYKDEFKQLMLHLVQDILDGSLPHVSAPQKIAQFVELVTATVAPILPPASMLGFSFQFIQWLSTTVLVNEVSVQRLLIAYAVDLICVLRELCVIPRPPTKMLTVTWPDLKMAIETYNRSLSRQRIRTSIRSYTAQGGRILTPDDFRNKLRELLYI